MAEPLQDTVEKALAEVLDPAVASLRRSLAQRIAWDLRAAQAQAADEAARAARTAVAEGVQVAVRRLFQASSITEVGSTLLETACAWAGRTALLVQKGDSLTGWRAFGFDRATVGSDGFAQAWASFEIKLPEAPAMAHAVERREAVVCLATADQISAALANLVALDANEKVYLFPLSLRQTVVAVLYADGSDAAQEVQPAAIDLLCAVAGIAMEAISSRPAPRGRAETESGGLELPGARPSVHQAPADWEKMPSEERDVHLRAQRFARVLVADLQLYRSEEIREGRRIKDLYGRLRDEIDKSREVYQRKFGHTPAGSVDYFHVELLHTLADDQEDALGPGYPGPMAAVLG